MDHLLEDVHFVPRRLLLLRLNIQRIFCYCRPLSISFDNLHRAHALIVHIQAEINCPKLSPAADVPLHSVLVNSAHLALLFRRDTACMDGRRAPLRSLPLR